MTADASLFGNALRGDSGGIGSEDAQSRIGDLVKRTKSDVGAPFETEALEFLRVLRATEPAAWFRVRKALGEAGAPLRDLDSLTKPVPPARETSERRQGEALDLRDPEPWPECVDGSELLSQVVGLLARFVTASREVLDAMAAWILFAHAVDAFDLAPLLCLSSPAKRCGKTTTLQVIGALVPRSLSTSNVSPAALFRSVERWKPTLLVDEADALFGTRATERSEEIRNLLNAGHTRGAAYVVRVVGEDHEPRRFGVFGAKCIALIGDLPDTVRDRSIVVPMRRRLPDERVERLRLDRLESLAGDLRRKAVRWAGDHADELRVSDPDVPESIASDRAQDNARPLLAIADACGMPWTERLRTAVATLAHGANEDEADELAVSLLRAVSTALEGADLPTADLLRKLNTDREAPWADWRAGEGTSARQLAARLRRFGVRPGKWRSGGDTIRGYRAADLVDAVARYSGNTPRPESPQTPRLEDHTGNGKLQSATQADLWRVENGQFVNDAGHVADVADSKGASGASVRKPATGLS